MGATLDVDFWSTGVTLLYGDVDLSEYVDWPLDDFASVEEQLTQTFTD